MQNNTINTIPINKQYNKTNIKHNLTNYNSKEKQTKKKQQLKVGLLFIILFIIIIISRMVRYMCLAYRSCQNASYLALVILRHDSGVI